jgi:hypothetical protein
MALDWSQLCILSARQSYIRQYGKMASGREEAFYVLCGASPHFHNEVRFYLDKSLRNRWIGHGDPMEWPPKSPDLTPTDLFLWSFVKDNVYVPPLPTTLYVLKTRIRHACANTDQEILHNVWQEVEHRFHVARATRGAHIELY